MDCHNLDDVDSWNSVFEKMVRDWDINLEQRINEPYGVSNDR